MEFNIRNYYIKPGYTDMRQGINGLMNTVIGEMALDPLGGDLFVFSGRDHSSIKMLYWSGDGFWLLQKRLSRYTFAWPKSELEVLTITEEELSMLLRGIDCWRTHAVLDAAKTRKKKL